MTILVFALQQFSIGERSDQHFHVEQESVQESSVLESCISQEQENELDELLCNEPEIVDASCALIDDASSINDKNSIHFIWPIDRAKFWVSSFFGPRKGPNGKKSFHTGIDMAALKRTPVTAAAAGVVTDVYEDRLGYGKTIVIKHDNIYKTRYAHLDSMLVSVGQQVEVGDLIGRVGDSGHVRKQGRDASHLHFELYELGKRVNPLYFLQ